MVERMLDYPLTDEMRRLYLKVWAGHEPKHVIASRLHYLDCHFPGDKLKPAIRWLIQNGLTGARFVEFVNQDCSGSNLELHRMLLAILYREHKKAVHILAGKDFVT